ncbi:amidohydrolase family protein [Lentilitoribacter sp. EG35]|uniref:amidohydrolase family protein n=1 Tax=Lentilitoribacter sp. EG35 TaxID=3234192 RepID=UPI00345FB4D4
MMMENAIDAHVHLWDPQRRDDILICDTHPELNDKATSVALRAHLAGCGFSRAIVVQSAPDDSHSEWLIKHASRLDQIAGVVAWIDPTATDALDRAKQLIAQPCVCGVRLMLNRMSNPGRLLNDEPMAVLTLLANDNVTIELLAPVDQLEFSCDLADQFSGKIVLDHCGLPPQNALSNHAWRNGLQKLAKRPNVATKMSGLIEPYEGMPTDVDLFAVMDFVCTQFGPQRLMAASNFPVAQLTELEKVWVASLVSWAMLRDFNSLEQAALWYDCAINWYPRLNPKGVIA